MKKILLAIIVGIFLISLVGATQQSLGTFKQGDDVRLVQTCGNCTYNNISTVLFPNSTIAISNVEMTRDDTFYNYTFYNTSIMGRYIVNGFGNPNGEKVSWVYDFEITGTGFEFNQSRSTLSLGLIGVLIFLFIITLGGISKLPSKDNYDDDGTLMSINQLKYFRPVLWVVAWFIVIAIMFTASNIAFAYMGSTLLANIIFTFFKIMLGLSLPLVVVWFCYVFYSMFKDKQMKNYLERGWE